MSYEVSLKKNNNNKTVFYDAYYKINNDLSNPKSKILNFKLTIFLSAQVGIKVIFTNFFKSLKYSHYFVVKNP